MSLAPKKILIVDDHADGRFLLVKTIHRKLPNAIVQECCDAAAAIYSVEHDRPDAAIVHRAGEVDGLSLIQLLRRVNPAVPILYVSGYDRRREAIEAGATDFLNYDAWLNVGTVISHLLHQQRPAASVDSIAPFATNGQPGGRTSQNPFNPGSAVKPNPGVPTSG